MTAPQRREISEWRAPQPTSKPGNHKRGTQRLEAIDPADLAQALELLVEQQTKVLDGLRHLNSFYIPVTVQPLLSSAIKNSDHTLKHITSARLLSDLENSK
jgi:hypothetical protein